MKNQKYEHFHGSFILSLSLETLGLNLSKDFYQDFLLKLTSFIFFKVAYLSYYG